MLKLKGLVNIKMKKVRVNWIAFFALFCEAIIFGILGLGLPNTINLINHLEEGALYGYFDSYVVLVLLFWFFNKDTKLTIKRESYFVSINNFIKKQLIKNRRKRK